MEISSEHLEMWTKELRNGGYKQNKIGELCALGVLKENLESEQSHTLKRPSLWGHTLYKASVLFHKIADKLDSNTSYDLYREG